MTKRSIDALIEEGGALSVEALHRFSTECTQRLTRLYAEKAWPYTVEFFRACGELFRASVLEPLCRSESLGFVAHLRGVCKQWQRWVSAVRQLRFNVADWDGSIYHCVLTRHFPLVRCLYANQGILEEWADSFARITRLVILPLEVYERTDTELDVSQWSSLNTLILPPLRNQVDGLAQLTTLTQLRAYHDAFEDIGQLSRLVQLRHLELFGAMRDASVTHLTTLAYMESDQPHHFTQFSGEGVLRGDMMDGMTTWWNGDAEGADEKQVRDDFALYGAGTYACKLKGRWQNGLFTGSGWLRFDRESHCQFTGHFVDGRRHGAGTESNYRKQSVFVGEWRGGARHGTGRVYTMSGNGRHYPRSGDWHALIAEEKWLCGVLTERVEARSD